MAPEPCRHPYRARGEIIPAACVQFQLRNICVSPQTISAIHWTTRATLLNGMQPPKRNRAGLRELLHDVMEGGAVYRAE